MLSTVAVQYSTVQHSTVQHSTVQYLVDAEHGGGGVGGVGGGAPQRVVAAVLRQPRGELAAVLLLPH